MKDEFVDTRLAKKKETPHDPGEAGTDPGTNKQTKIFIIIAAVFILGLMWFLIFGLHEEPEPNTVEYNYFVFEEIGGHWQTTITLDGQLYDASFRFNPEQVEDVNISGNFSGFKEAPIYITFDPDVEPEKFKYLALATSELSLHIIRALNFSVQAACTKNETDACVDRPIVTCDDPDKDVIYVQSEAPAEIVLDNRCVTVRGAEFDIVRSADRLLYQWYKIMR